MNNHPIVNPGDLIRVGLHDCIVQKLYPEESESYVCWVVYIHLSKPLKCPVSWNGLEWYIPDTNAISPARESEPYVHDLKTI